MFVLEQLYRVATASPGKLAMVFNGAPLTYDAFWRHIEGCRRSLQPQLPERGVAVLWVDSLLERWILIFALRSLGLDTVVIERADQGGLFDAADVACVITLSSERARQVDEASGPKHLTIDAPSRQAVSIAGPLPPMPELPPPGGNILLTSGTTGRYKKALNTFGADPVFMAERLARYASLGDGLVQPSGATILNVFNMGPWSGGGNNWPISIWALGGAVVFEQSGRHELAVAWPGITHTLATPWYLEQLLSLPEGAFPYCPRMQLMVTGDVVSPLMAKETIRRLTPRIMLMVGSTETGPWAWSSLRTEEDLRWHRPFPDRRIEVIDDADAPVRAGDLGRIRVELSPDDQARYLGDPETSAAFFRDGWFYPGDLGVCDAQGRVSLHGRTSDVVQIDGVKLPTEPWETAIRQKLGCGAVCVLAGDWVDGVERLHVFVQSSRPIPPEELAEALRSTISGFGKVQAHVVDSFPRTETGKVKRLALAQRLREGATRRP